jgi:electron transport complex protein RnfG
MSADANIKEQPMIVTGLILMLIGGVSALLLALVSVFTAPRIAANKIAKENAAVRVVFPGAERMEKNGDIIEVWQSGVLAGWMVKTSGKGYAGKVVIMVGIDSARKILGIQVLETKETPGLGTKIDEVKRGDTKPWFMAQFVGKDMKGRGFGQDGVNAISGATISSKAVLAGIQSAYAALDTAGN